MSDGTVAAGASRLFSPLTLRGVTLRNRVVVSPMAMYSADAGLASDFHLVHLGRFALGGAGLIFMEATAVAEDARITPGCLGLWNEEQTRAAARIVRFLHSQGAAAGIQIGHAGFKGASQRPWDGGAALPDGGWPTVAPSAEPFDTGWPAPHALSPDELPGIVEAFRHAARRASEAGFDVIELHCAHGYLLHQFLSPLSNRRDDAFGGSLANRMRLPLEVARAVRETWPAERPMFVRISAVDGIDVGWSLPDSIAFARELKPIGVDLVDCSTGGLRVPRERQVPARDPGFQVPYAAAVRREAGIATIAVGMIRTPAQAEEILASGAADLVALAREMLSDPNWAAKAAVELDGAAGWRLWPQAFRYWLERRARQLARS